MTLAPQRIPCSPPACHCRPEGGGGRQQHLGVHQPDDGQKVEGQFDRPVFPVPEGGVLVGEEGADPDHMGPELLDKPQVGHQIFGFLIGGPDHHPASHLVSQFPQGIKALYPVVPGHFRRMELFIMGFPGCLVAEEVAVSPGLFQPPVAFPAPFSAGEGDGAVGEPSPDGCRDRTQPLVGIIRVFAPLEDEGPKPQPVPFFTAA